MVVIHLSRGGRKGAPVYKIMVQKKGAKLTGKFLEKIGTYQPGVTKSLFEMKADRYHAWIALGAQVSPRLAKVYKDFLKTNPEAKALAEASAPVKATKAPKAAVEKKAPAAKKASAKK